MSTLLKYNLLLLISLITCQLNIFELSLNCMTLSMFFSKNVFVIIENYYTGSHFQMPKKIFCKEKAGLWSSTSSVYRLCGSIKHQTQ